VRPDTVVHCITT